MNIKIKIRNISLSAGKTSLFSVLFLSTVMLIAACNGSKQKDATAGVLCDPDNGGITLPEGFCATVVIDSLGLRNDHSARHLVVAENGDIYMKTRSGQGGIVALRDTNGDYRADIIKYFGNMNETKEGILWETGVAIHNGYLYASNTTSVYRWPMPKDGALVPEGEPEMVVSGFPQQQAHASKAFTFDNKGNLFVGVGAPSNACQVDERTPGSPGIEPCPLLDEHGGILMRIKLIRLLVPLPAMPQDCEMWLGLTGILLQTHFL